MNREKLTQQEIDSLMNKAKTGGFIPTKYAPEGSTCIGVILESYHDISIYVRDNVLYGVYYIGD